MQRKLEEEDIIGIISKVKQGQSQAFNILILTYEKEVFSLCLRILKHREEAEEAAQDCFIKAYKQIRSFKQEAKFSTWLYRIAYNNCLNKIKANKRRMLDTELEEEKQEISNADLSMDQLCINERKTYVNMAIAQLNTADATLLNLYYHNECSLAEIEEITGTTKETLKVQLYRARKRFETALGNILKGEIKSIL